MQSLDELNAASVPDFVAALGAIFEDSPWVAEQAAAARPFATVTALHGAMLAAVQTAPVERIDAFLRGHPELAGAAARAGMIGAESTAEQAALGLDRAAGETDEIAAMNAAYGARFGFPFILCVRRHSRPSLMAQFRHRLLAGPAAERATALREIGYITRLRLVDKVDGPGVPVVHGWLSTHVLDTAKGRPVQRAVGIAGDRAARHLHRCPAAGGSAVAGIVAGGGVFWPASVSGFDPDPVWDLPLPHPVVGQPGRVFYLSGELGG